MTNPNDYELRYTSDNGAEVWAHTQHGEAELPANLTISRFLAEFGKTVWLLPASNEPGTRNPDARIDGELWEFKTNHAATGTSVDTAIREAHKQAPNVLPYLTVPMLIPVLENAIYGRVRRCDRLSKISVLYENELFSFTKIEVLNQQFRGIIKGKGSPA